MPIIDRQREIQLADEIDETRWQAGAFTAPLPGGEGPGYYDMPEVMTRIHARAREMQLMDEAEEAWITDHLALDEPEDTAVMFARNLYAQDPAIAARICAALNELDAEAGPPPF